MSNDTAELFAALSGFQAEVEPPKKASENPHFRSRYADLAEVISTAKPHLAKHGLAVSQLAEGGDQAGVTITTMLTHKSGQWLRSSFAMPADKRTAQGFGSAISYGRRYALLAILGLAADDDDGESAEGRGGAKKGAAKQAQREAPAQGQRAAEQRQQAPRDPAPKQTAPDPEIVPGSVDEYGLRAPKSPCPRFSEAAKEHAGKLWTDRSAAWLLEKWLVDKARVAAMSSVQVDWAKYAVERRKRRKAAEAEAAEAEEAERHFGAQGSA